MRTALWAATLLACSSAVLPAAAKGGFQHQLFFTLKLETGETIDMPFLSYERSECLREAKQVEIGKEIPRGALAFPGGKTYAATMMGAKCVMTDRKN